MDKKTLELAKKEFKARTGLKRVSIKPYILKGTGHYSNVYILVNGKKMLLLSATILTVR